MRQRGRRSRGSDHQRNPQRTQTALCLAQFAGDKLLHSRKFFFRGRIAGKEFLGQANRAQRQAHCFLNAFALRERDLATPAADVDQQASALRPRFPHHSAVDEARLFQTGDDLYFPTSFGFDPGQKSLGIAGIAQGRSGYGANPVGAMHFDRAIETLQRHQGAAHRFRRDHAGFKDARSQPRHLAVLMEHFQLVLLDSRDFQSAGVGTNVNRCVRLHRVGKFHLKIQHFFLHYL